MRVVRTNGRFIEDGMALRRMLDSAGCRHSAMRPGMAQGVHNADTEQQQSQQHKTQGDTARLRTTVHAPLPVIVARPLRR